MSQFQQNRRMAPNQRNRGGQNRFDNRKPPMNNQGMGDNKLKKQDRNENQESKSQKPQQSQDKKPELMKSPAPKHIEHHKQSHHQNEHGGDNSEQQDQLAAPKKFTGRCRLFVGNLPNDTTDDQFRALFAPYGELSELFVNPSRGFGFVRLDTRQNAEAAKAALDGVQKKNRVLRVRFATHGAALKIKFLPAHVSNELLEEAFSNFGNVERAVVIVDDRGKPTGEAIVEFARKPAAQQALQKINDGAFLLGSSPRPVLAEPLEQKDEDDGYPEKFILKNAYYHKEREQTPRFAPPGSFEFEMAQKWKEAYRMEADHKVQLQREMEQAIARLELEQEQALHEHQAMLLRQDLMRRQEELRKLEERQMEMAKRMEMKRQEDDMRRQEDERHRQEMMMRQQQEQEMRRRQMESRAGRGPSGPGGPGLSDEFDMRSGGSRSMDRVSGRSNFNEMRGGRGMESRGRGDYNEGPAENMGGGGGNSMGGGSSMRRGGSERGGAPPMQPPPAPPAALGLDRQRQGGGNQGMGSGNQGGGGGGGGGSGGGGGGGGGGGNQSGMGNNSMRQSRFDQSAGNQGGFSGNSMGPGGNRGNGGMGNNAAGNMGPGSSMGGRQMGGGGMNRRREGGPSEDFFESKRPRF